MKKRNVILILSFLLASVPLAWSNTALAAVAHEGHFNVEVGDQFEYVWASLKDSEENPVTDASYSYPDAPGSNISEGDHFYIDITEINMTVINTTTQETSPYTYGIFSFADGSSTPNVTLRGYFKAMNSSEYNWTYWQSDYESKGYTVDYVEGDYFQYNTTMMGGILRFKWDATDGAMLEWEMTGMWIQMMGFGTLSEILIERYESVADYGAFVGDKIWLEWGTIKDSEGNPITDGSYAYPDAPDSQISQGDVFYIEITTINTSMMGTSVYGKFVFGDVSSNETMLMGYVKSREWKHNQLYYTYKEYTVTNNATHFGYQSGSTMGGPLLKMLWDRTNGIIDEFHLKGFWIQMMGFGTVSEIRLLGSSDPTDTTTEPEVSTTTDETTTTDDGSTPGFEAVFLLISLMGIAAISQRKKK
ncbi:hypothetical protein CEE45_08150 [Candidatus Heimdallarchaeota archaeon B3_Heim]|nr:MAG: hypothetical protein CEE45_08150 [Candidatus Heimdallarchaeota archaeon B3_Heim]